MRPVLPYVDASTQASFVSAWVDFFDFHRRAVDFGLPGVGLSMAALVFGLYLLPFVDEDDAGAPRFLLRTIIVASAFALMGAGVSRLPASAVPTLLLTLMPTRLFLLSNLAFVAALFGLLIVFPNVLLRATALLLSVCLAAGNNKLAMYSLIFSAVALMILKSVSSPDRNVRFASASRWVTVLTGVVLVALSVRGVIGNMRTASAYRSAMVDRTNSVVLASAATTPGLIAIGTQCCSFTQMKTRRPLLVETMALDQIMYAPESAPDMNSALTAVYGVDLLHPLEILRSTGFSEDLTPVTRPLWESRSAEEWKRLGIAFGFTAILTKPNWTLRLPAVARDSEYVLYQVP
jgi:hypothetical protein